jgi:hypothetical protein
MNIVIVEQLNKAIRQSNDLLKAIPEQSLKRRHQLEQYTDYKRTTSWYKDIINSIKTYWYC